MNMNGMLAYTEGEFFGVGGLRRYETEEGNLYFVGSNEALETLYNVYTYMAELLDLEPRYTEHPLMNLNRHYGLEIRDGKFAIVTAEKLVENILKW